MSLRDGASVRDALLVGGEDRGLGERCAALVLGRWRLRVRVLPRARGETDGDRLRLFAAQRAGVEREPTGAQPRGLARGERPGAAKRRGAVRRFTESDEQHARGARGTPGEMECLVTASAEVAPLEQSSECTTERSV